MKHQEIIKTTSERIGVPELVVKEAYESFFSHIRGRVKNLPLKEDLTKELFNLLLTNFNIPSLGKLSCTYERMEGVKKKFNYTNKSEEGRLKGEISRRV